MSLILEALRKSEAERRRGAAPDVAMELPPTPRPHPRALPAWLLPAALFALAALAALWWSQRAPATPEETASPQTDAAAPPAIAAPAVVVRAPPQSVAPRPVQAPTAVASAPLATTAPSQSPPAVPASALSTPSANVASIDDTALPPIKLSMHMWDESPTRRFVILDGQRMGEGDRNGELFVVAIERDGVVIERNGQRARVPLP